MERPIQAIREELLSRVKFAGYGDAATRIRAYIEGHNAERTHQGIRGHRPADRFYGVVGEVGRAESHPGGPSVGLSRCYPVYEAREHRVSVVRSAESLQVYLDGRLLVEADGKGSRRRRPEAEGPRRVPLRAPRSKVPAAQRRVRPPVAVRAGVDPELLRGARVPSRAHRAKIRADDCGGSWQGSRRAFPKTRRAPLRHRGAGGAVPGGRPESLPGVPARSRHRSCARRWDDPREDPLHAGGRGPAGTKIVSLAEGIIDHLRVKTLERDAPPGMARLGNPPRFDRAVRAEARRESVPPRALPEKGFHEPIRPEASGESWAEDFADLAVEGHSFELALLLDVYDRLHMGAEVDRRAAARLVGRPAEEARAANGGRDPSRFLLSDDGSPHISEERGNLLTSAGIVERRIPVRVPPYDGSAEGGMRTFQSVLSDVREQRARNEADEGRSPLGWVRIAVTDRVRLVNDAIPRPCLDGVTAADVHRGRAPQKRKEVREYRAKKPAFFCRRPLRRIAHRNRERVG